MLGRLIGWMLWTALRIAMFVIFRLLPMALFILISVLAFLLQLIGGIGRPWREQWQVRFQQRLMIFPPQSPFRQNRRFVQPNHASGRRSNRRFRSG